MVCSDGMRLRNIYNYGKFIHIMDIEGNKIELWEPNDIEYDKFPGERTK